MKKINKIQSPSFLCVFEWQRMNTEQRFMKGSPGEKKIQLFSKVSSITTYIRHVYPDVFPLPIGASHRWHKRKKRRGQKTRQICFVSYKPYVMLLCRPFPPTPTNPDSRQPTASLHPDQRSSFQFLMENKIAW